MAVNQPELAVNLPNAQSPASLALKLGGSYVGLRNDLEISRHVFMGEISYIVRDPISFEGHNFTPTDYEILISLNAERSLQETFESLRVRELVTEIQAEDFYRFVIELQVRGLLSLPITDGESLYRQYEQKQRRQSANPLMKLLFLKIPLGCPDYFLRSTYHCVRPLFTRTFFTIWVIGLVAAIGCVVSRWEAFSSELVSLLAIQNFFALLLVMSALKLWHELGHGYACRHYGVSVPNAGLMLMFGTPLAFVDATGSWSLPLRRQRQVINLAGIYFEMMIAIVAAFVWAFSDNAAVQSMAHFTLLISSVTTIAFNFNPLMKYDGYFVLADLLGIPNLRGRAALATTDLCKRIFFGIGKPTTDSLWLRLILVSYGISAGVYKSLLLIGISCLMAMQIWIIGLLVGGYYLVSSSVTILRQLVKYLLCAEEIQHRRPLAIAYLSLMAVGIPTALWICPVPGGSSARGVVESAAIHVLHVKDGGFLTASFVQTGQKVQLGEPLGQIENTSSVARHQHQQAELQQLETQYRTEQLNDRVQANQTWQRIRRLQFELDLQPQGAALELVQAPVSGQILSCKYQRGTGNYLAPGTELLRIGDAGWIVRAVANTRSLAETKPQVGQTVHCRFHSDPQRAYPATIQSVSPAGSRIVKHAALTHLAGGLIPVDPATLEAMEPFFELTLTLTTTPPEFLRNGAVCEIRFEREHESLGKLIYRSLLRFVNQIETK